MLATRRDVRLKVAKRMFVSFALTPLLAIGATFLFVLNTMGGAESAGESASGVAVIGVTGVILCTPALLLFCALVGLAPFRLIAPFGGWPFVIACALSALGLIYLFGGAGAPNAVDIIGAGWASASGALWAIWQWRRPLRLAPGGEGARSH